MQHLKNLQFSHDNVQNTVALYFDETVMSNWRKRESPFLSSLFCRAVIFQNSCATHETFYTFTQPHRTVREKGNEAAAKRCWWMVKKSNCEFWARRMQHLSLIWLWRVQYTDRQIWTYCWGTDNEPCRNSLLIFKRVMLRLYKNNTWTEGWCYLLLTYCICIASP